MLAQAGLGRAFLTQKNVRDEMRKYLIPFREIIVAAGLLK
jgi:hypothetical protein